MAPHSPLMVDRGLLLVAKKVSIRSLPHSENTPPCVQALASLMLVISAFLLLWLSYHNTAALQHPSQPVIISTLFTTPGSDSRGNAITFSEEENDWNSCREHCNAHGASLATIGSAE